jgi:hypothetical protein
MKVEMLQAVVASQPRDPASYSEGPGFQISARRQATLTEGFHDFPHSLQANDFVAR